MADEAIETKQAPLTLADLQTGAAQRIEAVDLNPDMDRVAYVRQLTTQAMIDVSMQYGKDAKSRQIDPNFPVRNVQLMVCATLCDETGSLILPQDDLSIAWLNKLPWAVVARLNEVANRLNPTDGKYVEEKAKNSPPQNMSDSSAA